MELVEQLYVIFFCIQQLHTNVMLDRMMAKFYLSMIHVKLMMWKQYFERLVVTPNTDFQFED